MKVIWLINAVMVAGVIMILKKIKDIDVKTEKVVRLVSLPEDLTYLHIGASDNQRRLDDN